MTTFATQMGPPAENDKATRPVADQPGAFSPPGSPS